jgi:hypothetical protein
VIELNLPVYYEKEAAMQIEDKISIDDLADAVSLATQKLKLASSILFQSKAVNLIENLVSYKNVNNYKIDKT